ncbi:MAG: DUF1559 domain-containing protein [Planctomycetota bacterium]
MIRDSRPFADRLRQRNNRRTRARRITRTGLSFVDVVVLMVATVLVVSLVLLRVRGSREFSRRMNCEDNLRAIHLGMESYTLRYGTLPIGTQNPVGPIRSERVGRHHNWAEGVLEFLVGLEELADRIDFADSVYSPNNTQVGNTAVPIFRCITSSQELAPFATTYAGVTSSTERAISRDGDGLFILNRPIRLDQVLDGLSYTFLVGEKSVDFGPPEQWNSGTRTSLRNLGHAILLAASSNVDSNDPLFVGGFSSRHIGGAYFLFADGSFRFFSDQADQLMLQNHASRAADVVEN